MRAFRNYARCGCQSTNQPPNTSPPSIAERTCGTVECRNSAARSTFGSTRDASPSSCQRSTGRSDWAVLAADDSNADIPHLRAAATRALNENRRFLRGDDFTDVPATCYAPCQVRSADQRYQWQITCFLGQTSIARSCGRSSPRHLNCSMPCARERWTKFASGSPAAMTRMPCHRWAQHRSATRCGPRMLCPKRSCSSMPGLALTCGTIAEFTRFTGQQTRALPIASLGCWTAAPIRMSRFAPQRNYRSTRSVGRHST